MYTKQIAIAALLGEISAVKIAQTEQYPVHIDSKHLSLAQSRNHKMQKEINTLSQSNEQQSGQITELTAQMKKLYQQMYNVKNQESLAQAPWAGYEGSANPEGVAPPVLPWENQTLGEALMQSSAPWAGYDAVNNPEAVAPPVLPWEPLTPGLALMQSSAPWAGYDPVNNPEGVAPPVLPWEPLTPGLALMQSSAPWAGYDAVNNPEGVAPPVLPWEPLTPGLALMQSSAPWAGYDAVNNPEGVAPPVLPWEPLTPGLALMQSSAPWAGYDAVNNPEGVAPPVLPWEPLTPGLALMQSSAPGVRFFDERRHQNLNQFGTYPYLTVGDKKAKRVLAKGGDPSLEPLETGSLKTRDNLYDMTKNIMRQGFKEKKADTDSITERIRNANRSHGKEEQTRIRENNQRQRDILRRATWESRGLGIQPYPAL